MYTLINKLKAWLIHRLGGYTSAEATLNNKIRCFTHTHRYHTNPKLFGNGGIHKDEHDKAVDAILEQIRPYINVQDSRNHLTHEWIIRLSIRTIDEYEVWR